MQQKPLTNRSISSTSSLQTTLYNLKILIIGEANVGKTSLHLRYTENVFNQVNPSTTAMDYKRKIITVNGQSVNLTIWDTVGLEKYHSIAQSYLKNAHGILLCFDISQRKTFDNLSSFWIKFVSDCFIEKGNDESSSNVIVLVGTKIDLGDVEDNRKVSANEAHLFAQEKLKGEYYETSALTGEGVNDLFMDLAQKIMNEQMLYNDSNFIQLGDEDEREYLRDNSGKSC